jgi:glutamyl-tRNA reductase
MLTSLAVDYHHADVATREGFHLTDVRLTRMYESCADDIVHEILLIATCNRTELYAWIDTDDREVVDRAVSRLARRWGSTKTRSEALLDTARRRYGVDVAEHALRVAAGLESQVLGDGQILGQMRAAYRRATELGRIGPVLHRLFEAALHTGKRVQSETLLSAGRASVGAEAAALASARFGNLAHARVVVVGCGKTGGRAARQLDKLGARDIVLINRTPRRADDLAHALKGRGAPIEALHLELAMADVAIVATGADRPLVEAEQLAACRASCGSTGYPLLMLDLGLPRNIEPEAAHLEGVAIVDLDTLHPPIVAAQEQRRSAIPVAEAIVADELRRFADWSAESNARRAIRPLHDALTQLCAREVAFVLGDDGAVAAAATAERAADRIVAKLLARPMSAFRARAARGEPVDDLATALDALFAAGGVS